MKENEMHRLLETAQATYGYANQVTVAVEELCELGAVLSKYPRYDLHDDALVALRDKVVEEVADVIIMMRHIQMIFNIQPTDLDAMIDKKLNRLKRWLENDNKSFQHTTEDRVVGEKCTNEHCCFPECDHVCGYDPEKHDNVVVSLGENPKCTQCYYWEHVDEGVCEECFRTGGGPK